MCSDLSLPAEPISTEPEQQVQIPSADPQPETALPESSPSESEQTSARPPSQETNAEAAEIQTNPSLEGSANSPTATGRAPLPPQRTNAETTEVQTNPSVEGSATSPIATRRAPLAQQETNTDPSLDGLTNPSLDGLATSLMATRPAHQLAETTEIHTTLPLDSPEILTTATRPAPRLTVPVIPFQQPVIPRSSGFADHRAQQPNVLPQPIFPMEYGYQYPGSQPRRALYPVAAVPLAQPVYHSYNPRVPSFYPPENHSPYSPTETPSGLRSEPWSVPNQSAASNSSVEAEVKPEQQAPAVESDATVTLGENTKVDQNEIMHAVTTAEVVPTPEPLMGVVADEDEDGLSSLPKYLLSMFQSADYTDWSLQIVSKQHVFEYTPIYIHALLASRSPFLHSQMKTHYENPNGISVIVFNSSHRFLRPLPLQFAVQRLYGDSLLQHEALAQVTRVPAADGIVTCSLKAQIEFALGYSAAGNLLQLPGVERRGLRLAVGCLDWDTLETALSFGLTGDVKFWVKTNDETQRNSSPKSGVSRRSSQLTETDPSNPYHQAQDNRRLLEIAGGTLAEAQPFANEVSKAAFNFIISNFPANFELDTSAQPLDMPDRLPAVNESKPAKARLTSLRFGSFLSEDEIRFSNECRIISRVFLAIPFDMLAALFSGLKEKITPSIAIQVIQEREKRRLLVLNSKVGGHDRLENNSDWYAVGWEESVKEMDGHGFELTKTPKGLQESTEEQAS
jgi:hypothetical protein